MYYNARYYDPSLGRFLQADTYLDGMNRYTYCGNNPIMYNDPTGHIADWVIGFGIYAFFSYIKTAAVSNSYAGWNPIEWDKNDWNYFASFRGQASPTIGVTNSGDAVFTDNNVNFDINSGDTQRQEDIDKNLKKSESNLDYQITDYGTKQYYADLLKNDLDNDSLIPEPENYDELLKYVKTF